MRSFLLRDWHAFLRYEDLPGGYPSILYLSGLGMPAHAVFADVVAQHPGLGARRSVFVDLLGCGFSDAPDDFDYTLEQYTRTVAMLLDHLGVAGCYVAGYSMGGAVAITPPALILYRAWRSWRRTSTLPVPTRGRSVRESPNRPRRDSVPEVSAI